MFEALASSNWAGLILLILLWMVIVRLALWTLDRLFPRIERSRDDRAELPHPHPRSAAVRALPRPKRATGTATRSAQPPLVQAPPAQAQPPAALPTPAWLVDYWRASQRVIGPLLVIWLASFVLPAALAPMLNQIRILTGFPLGYYMGAQGSLIIFIALIFIYAWRMARLDQRFQLDLPPLSAEERRYRHQLLQSYGGFALLFLLFTLVLGILEIFARIPTVVISWMFLLLTIGVYAVIGLRSRIDTLDDYYVAGRRVPGLFNGLATGSDWMSAASFISMAGALWLLGYEGLAYILGWTGGYVLLAMLLAPYLRKSGHYTVADFVGARYEGTLVHIVAAIASIIISFTYVTAQVTGIGIIMSYFLGVHYMFGVIIGLSAVLLCSYMGGMQAVTWTQVAQGLIMVIAYLVPVTWLSFQLTGIPIPQLMYGEALRNIEQLETAQGITRSYVAAFNDWTFWDFIALVLCLMLGTAGMPHILIRFYTVTSVRESRSSVGWALVFICLLYFTAPAYAAFSRWEILQDVVGRPIAELPGWAENWSHTGLLNINDAPEDGGNGDGILQFSELYIDQDLVVLATPEIAGLPSTVVALVAAGGLAAALSTADGLLLVIASATVHDIYYRTFNPRASPRERLFLGRVTVLVAAVLAALTAIQRLGIIVQMVAWAFSLAAATFFPVLVLGIFWKGANSRGAAAGMISGMVVTAGYMMLTYTNPDLNLLGISHSAAGIFGIPINFLVTWIVSRFGPAPSPQVQTLVDNLRHP